MTATLGTAERQRVRDRPVLLAALGAGCISCSGILVVLAAAGAATTAFYRCAFALPGLVALAILEQRRHGSRTSSARAASWFAGLFFAVDLVLWTHAIVEVGAGVATVLGNLQVVFVALAAWMLLKERPTAQFLLALPVVLGGVVLVSGLVGHRGVGRDPLAGILYGAATSLAYAAFLLILRRSTRTAHVAGPLADATAGAAVGSLLLGAMFGGLDLAPAWPALGWLLLLAVTSQTLGWLLITSSLPRLPSAVSSLLLLLQPVAALALAFLVLGERPSWLQLLGALLICAGVMTVARSAAASAPVGEPAGT
ncbi:MAG: DMT family transporter [Candidatus Dormibacteraeota bacterium]|uniref:DMT family transporter n=1 Tax=Candidatus Amunia macphersoniae TaxID=3127014 RepID=A0A934KJK2_9BACT|nr:DMT family transporter [Candidatus Dormibacteraeota bacterium]